MGVDCTVFNSTADGKISELVMKSSHICKHVHCANCYCYCYVFVMLLLCYVIVMLLLLLLLCNRVTFANMCIVQTETVHSSQFTTWDKSHLYFQLLDCFHVMSKGKTNKTNKKKKTNKTNKTNKT